MKTREEIKQWLLKNSVDKFGRLDLSGLDFSDFDGDILACHWIVKGSLYQSDHRIGGDLFQDSQVVQGSLLQSEQIVKGSIVQSNQVTGGSIFQQKNQVAFDELHDDKK